MIRLMLDHLRRWGWVVALAGGLAFVLGGSIARQPEEPFELWVLLLSIWAGALLLSSDLKHGLARAVGTLPLTARQIGRTWWLATVVLPALVLIGALYAGAAAFFWHFHPEGAWPDGRLGLASLFIIVWLGVSFISSFGIDYDSLASRRKQIYAALFSALAMFLLFGSLLAGQNTSRNPIKLALFLGIGAVLTAAGWGRAERLVVGRASFRLIGIQVPDRRAGAAVRSGYGGIPYLIATQVVRLFFICGATAALVTLILTVTSRNLPGNLAVSIISAMSGLMAAWIVVFMQITPLGQHLRYLRTLPISEDGLATVFLSLAIFPLVALAPVAAGIAWLNGGVSAALLLLKSFTVAVAPVSICAFFTVWRGAGKLTILLHSGVLFGFFSVPYWLQAPLGKPVIPFRLTATVVVLCVLVAFLLTRRALAQGSRIYRAEILAN